MTTLATISNGDSLPMTAQQVRANINLIQEVMRSVMQDGVHYGKVPGCGDKPALFKPGAEKIMATFRIAADPEVEDLSSSDEVRYRIRCRGVSGSGALLGVGVGECSSNEEKYKWRGVRSNPEWNATPDDRRRIKYTDRGEERQVRTNPSDVANTILKMAKKRALVDMTLTVTAASDIFTQDIEDEDAPQQAKPEISPPQKRARPQEKQAQPQAGHSENAESGDVFPPSYAENMHDGDKAKIQGVLAWDADAKTTGNQGKPFFIFKLKHDEGGQPVSFSHWGDIPAGLAKGSQVIFDCIIRVDGSKTYRNAENMQII